MRVFRLVMALPPNRGWFAIAKNGTLDAESFGLSVDGLSMAPKRATYGHLAFDSSALVVDEFVSVAGAVEGVTDAGTDAGGHPQGTFGMAVQPPDFQSL